MTRDWLFGALAIALAGCNASIGAAPNGTPDDAAADTSIPAADAGGDASIGADGRVTDAPTGDAQNDASSQSDGPSEGDAPPASTGVAWGATTHAWTPYDQFTTEQLYQQQIGLGLVGPERGAHELSSSSGYGALAPLIDAYAAHGMPVIILLNPDPNTYPDETSAYDAGKSLAQGAVSAAAGHGQGRVYWELGNEYEIRAKMMTGDGNSPSNYDQAVYALARGMIRGLHDGVKAADARAPTIVHTAGWLHYGFLEMLWADGVRWDITGEHWYSDMGLDLTSVSGQHIDVLAKLAQFGHDIWFTEFNANANYYDDATMASQLPTLMANLDAQAATYHVRVVCIYELLTEDQLGGGEGRFGLLNADGTINVKGQAVKDYLTAHPSATVPAY